MGESPGGRPGALPGLDPEATPYLQVAAQRRLGTNRADGSVVPWNLDQVNEQRRTDGLTAIAAS